MNFAEIACDSPAYRQECALRQAVLRAPLGLNLYAEDLSRERQQRHFGLFADDGRLLACAIAVPLAPATAKIRQMAVAPACQGQGQGRELLLAVERELAREGVRQLILHARLTAVGFYEKLGYRRHGPEFTEVGIPHVEMEKRIGCP